MSVVNENRTPDSGEFRDSLSAAREGCNQSLGHVLGTCRAYLLAVANAECPDDLGGKVAPSDLVQQTLLEAHRDFGQFDGQRREHMLAWLNQIFRNNMLNAIRQYRSTAMRQVSREISTAELPEETDPHLEPDDSSPGPSSWAIAQEESWLLEQALARLPDDYRQAVTLRNWHQLSFVEVGSLMQRSPEAARKLWTRAIKLLQAELKDLR